MSAAATAATVSPPPEGSAPPSPHAAMMNVNIAGKGTREGCVYLLDMMVPDVIEGAEIKGSAAARGFDSTNEMAVENSGAA